MKKSLVIILTGVVVLLFLSFLIWKDLKSYPEKSYGRKEATECALELYNKAKNDGMEFNSQCLGRCGDYSVDIVHNPRSEEDNKIENQCEDFRKGITKYFVELDKDGKIVRVFD